MTTEAVPTGHPWVVTTEAIPGIRGEIGGNVGKTAGEGNPSKGEERTVLCNVGHSEAATKEQAAGTSPSPSGDIVRRAPKYPAPGSGTHKVFSAGAGTVRRQAADGKAGMGVPADAEPGIRRIQHGDRQRVVERKRV